MLPDACKISVTTGVTIFAFLIGIKEIYAEFNSSDCGVMRGCLFVPEHCDVATDCQFAFSYQKDGEYLNMELCGRPPVQDAYIAVGFSRDAEMGDDMVVFCARHGGKIASGLAKNEEKPKNAVQDSSGIQQDIKLSEQDGAIYCAIRQLIDPGRPELFKLDQAYYILFATGGFSANELSYHAENRYVMSKILPTAYVKGVGQVSDQPADDGTIATKDLLKVIHGVSMTISWTIFLSTGMLFARHKEGPCPSTMVCGMKLWFHCHRALNLIGIFGTVCGMVCMAIAKDFIWPGPWPGQSPELNWRAGSVHSLFGLVACVVAWSQPINAMLRCPLGKPQRIVFNLVHGGLGLFSWVCAVVATMIATLKFHGMLSDSKVAACAYVIFIFVSLQTIVSTELLSCIREDKGKPKQQKAGKPKEQQSGGAKSDKLDSREALSADVSKSKEDTTPSKDNSKEPVRQFSKENIRSKEGSREAIKTQSKEDIRDNVSEEESEAESPVDGYVDLAHQIQLGILVFFIIVATVVALAISYLILKKKRII